MRRYNSLDWVAEVLAWIVAIGVIGTFVHACSYL